MVCVCMPALKRACRPWCVPWESQACNVCIFVPDPHFCLVCTYLYLVCVYIPCQTLRETTGYDTPHTYFQIKMSAGACASDGNYCVLPLHDISVEYASGVSRAKGGKEEHGISVACDQNTKTEPTYPHRSHTALAYDTTYKITPVTVIHHH